MMEKTKSDRPWREYDIHIGDDDAKNGNIMHNSGESKSDAENMDFLLFQKDEDALEEVEFTVTSASSSSSTPIMLKLTCQEDYNQSTGMSIWKGSEILSDYLQQSPEVVSGKTVLEVGAGAGLVGLTAYHLGARRVLWTDGDEKVLENLRKNVQKNAPTLLSSIDECCPQLIWGKHIEVFRKQYGRADVVLGTDLFYMTRSLDPLFQTVNEILVEDGVFVTVNSCASQSSMKGILDIAKRNGFVWQSIRSCSQKLAKENNDVVDEETEDDLIFIFSRS